MVQEFKTYWGRVKGQVLSVWENSKSKTVVANVSHHHHFYCPMSTG